MRYGIYFAATAMWCAMPAVAAAAPIYAPPGAWVVPHKTPLAESSDARPWLLADQQVLIEGDKRSTFTDSAFRIQSAEILRNWSDMTFEWQPDRDDLIIHSMAIIRDGKSIDLLAQGLKLNVLQREKGFEERAIDGRLTATAPIEDLRVGDTVRFSTTLVERSTVLKGNGEALLDLAADPAPKDCARAVELSQNSAAVLDSRAMIYFRLGRLDEARADLDAALKLSPGEPGSLFMRGIIRGRSDDKLGAIADLSLARLQNGQIDKTYAGYGIKAQH